MTSLCRIGVETQTRTRTWWRIDSHTARQKWPLDCNLRGNRPDGVATIMRLNEKALPPEGAE